MESNSIKPVQPLYKPPIDNNNNNKKDRKRAHYTLALLKNQKEQVRSQFDRLISVSVWELGIHLIHSQL
jgi:hypothetical protein